MTEFRNLFIGRTRSQRVRNRSKESLNESRNNSPKLVSGLQRQLYVGMGILFVIIAGLGALLPILPSTPFLILASSFFVKSSPTLQMRLLNAPVWGPLLQDWNEHKAVRRRTKWLAMTLILVGTTISAVAGQLGFPLIVLLIGLSTIGLIVVYRLPVICHEIQPEPESQVEYMGTLDRIGIRIHESHVQRNAFHGSQDRLPDRTQIERLS